MCLRWKGLENAVKATSTSGADRVRCGSARRISSSMSPPDSAPNERRAAAAGLRPRPAVTRSAGETDGGDPLTRRVVLAMTKRRSAVAELPASTCCHTFRATGITAYL